MSFFLSPLLENFFIILPKRGHDSVGRNPMHPCRAQSPSSRSLRQTANPVVSCYTLFTHTQKTGGLHGLGLPQQLPLKIFPLQPAAHVCALRQQEHGHLVIHSRVTDHVGVVSVDILDGIKYGFHKDSLAFCQFSSFSKSSRFSSRLSSSSVGRYGIYLAA